MELQHCAFCGKTVAPELPHYEIGNIHVCLLCGGSHTLSQLAGLDLGFKAVSDIPVATYDGLPGQTDSEEEKPEAFYWDYVGSFELTDEIKQRVEGLYEACAAKWEECHDKDEVYKLHQRLAGELVNEYKVPCRALGIAEPAYVRSDGTIHEVSGSLVEGGCSNTSFEEIELQEDIECMSEDDFLSKYVDNPDALEEYQEWHKHNN